LNVKVLAAGALTHSLPEGRTVVEGEGLTVKRLLDLLVARYGAEMERELRGGEGLREGLVLLVNGRNVLSLPCRFDTSLRDGDEILITILVAGG
jgi:molybdopterin converting factor small subunit